MTTIRKNAPRTLRASHTQQGVLLALCLLTYACGEGASSPSMGGVSDASGGVASGGTMPSGGTTSGGSTATGASMGTSGGEVTGGTVTGGATTGGTDTTGGESTGGAEASGGQESGGMAATGGQATGGSGSGGTERIGRFCEAPLPTGAPLTSYNATATTVSNAPAFQFLEGPVWLDAPGVLLFSEMNFGSASGNGPQSKIWRLSPSGQFDVFVPANGSGVATSGSNGLALALDGAVLAATHDTQSVSQYSYPSGARTELVGDPPGIASEFNSPNDLTMRSDGTLYFTDPDWQRDGRTGTGALTGLYARQTTGEVVLLDGTLPLPNGVTLSPDETVLYVAAVDGQVYSFPVNPDGSLGGREVFASPGSPDGMTVDCAGHLYVAASSGTVFVYAPNGTLVAEIDSAPSTTNVAFGGADHRTLYITADGTLQSIRLAHPGAPY